MKIKSDERFVCISTPNIIGCDDSGGALKVTKLEKGTKISLTGKAIKLDPIGFTSAFKSEMIYLECKIYEITAWIPLFQLSTFSEYNHESQINAESNRLLGINDSTWSNTLECFN